jgi:hypothetical protein
MALRTSLPEAAQRFGLEDVFVAGDAVTLAWVSGWRKLPHLKPEVTKLFDYPQQFAEDMFTRIEQALRRRAADGGAPCRTGHLVVQAEADSPDDSTASLIPELAVRYIKSSDIQMVAAGKAEAQDEAQLLNDRREARCVLSYKTPGGWVAITKAILTEVLGAGHDVKIVGLPPAAAGALTLMCPNLTRTLSSQ